MTVTGAGIEASFHLDEHVRHNLRNGLDDIALTLQDEALIADYEGERPAYRPALQTA